MKKDYIFFMITMIVSLFVATGTVFAVEDNAKTCTAQDFSKLRQMAASVKVSYIPRTEIVESDYEDEETGATKYTKRYLDIKIYNLNTRLYVDVMNNMDYNLKVSADDLGEDGTITFRQDALDRKVNYTFEIKSTEYGCELKTLRTIKLTLPMFNAYSQLDVCSDIPDYYLCQEYVTQKVDGVTFYDKVDAYKEKLANQEDAYDEESNTSTVNKVFKKTSKFKYVIVGFILILGTVITILILRRKENV